MPSHGGFRLPPSELESHAGRTADRASQVESHAAALGGTSLPGHSLGPLASGTASAVNTHVRRAQGSVSSLGAQLQGIATRERTTAGNYRDADQRAAESFNKIMTSEPASKARSPRPAGPVQGLGTTVSSVAGGVRGWFTPASKVRPEHIPGVTTVPSINAQTPGAGRYGNWKFPDLKNQNPTGSKQNCTLTVTAVADMLDGRHNPAPAISAQDAIGATVGPTHPLRLRNPSGTPQDFTNWDDVINAAGQTPGSRGVVTIYRAPPNPSHVINVAHTDDGVVFLDGQSGQLGKLEKIKHDQDGYPSITTLRYFQYHPPAAAPAPTGPAPAAAPALAPPAAAPAATTSDHDPEVQDWLHYQGFIDDQGGGNNP